MITNDIDLVLIVFVDWSELSLLTRRTEEKCRGQVEVLSYVTLPSIYQRSITRRNTGLWTVEFYWSTSGAESHFKTSLSPTIFLIDVSSVFVGKNFIIKCLNFSNQL